MMLCAWYPDHSSSHLFARKLLRRSPGSVQGRLLRGSSGHHTGVPPVPGDSSLILQGFNINSSNALQSRFSTSPKQKHPTKTSNENIRKPSTASQTQPQQALPQVYLSIVILHSSVPPKTQPIGGVGYASLANLEAFSGIWCKSSSLYRGSGGLGQQNQTWKQRECL